MRIRFSAVEGMSGYAEFGRSFIDALRSVGACVNEGGAVDVNIINRAPTDFAAHVIPGAVNVGFTMFETNRLPRGWADYCNELDGIIVPATYCEETFRNSGVRTPIAVVPPPHGVLPTRLGDGTRFLSVFQWSERKDPRALLTAYWTEFRPDERISLTLKTYPFGSFKIHDAICVIRDSLRLKSYAKVDVIGQTLSDAKMIELVSSHDCFVSAHHSEGWGMSLVQAMSAGKPVIATDFGASRDYLTSDNGYPVACTSEKCPEFKPYYDRSMSWGAVYVDELRAAMRHVFNHPQEARSRGLQARRDVEEYLSPKRCANMLLAAVRKIEKRPRKASPMLAPKVGRLPGQLWPI